MELANEQWLIRWVRSRGTPCNFVEVRLQWWMEYCGPGQPEWLSRHLLAHPRAIGRLSSIDNSHVVFRASAGTELESDSGSELASWKLSKDPTCLHVDRDIAGQLKGNGNAW